jgi:hypothetical protein
MTIGDAVSIYGTKMGINSRTVDYSKSQVLNPRMVILKDCDGNRLACIVESKKGYTIDVVKKMHGYTHPFVKKEIFRDRYGRFAKQIQVQ